MRHCVLLGFLLVTVSCPTSAQYVFDSWTTDNGLPQNGVRNIAQTSDGYLWFTTLDGLVRFDGVHFTIFDKANTEGIATNRFSSLAVDSEGTLWLGTEERGITVRKNGIFTSYSPDELPGMFDNEFSPDSSGEMRMRLHTAQSPSGAWYVLRNSEFVLFENTPRPDKQITFRGREGTEWTLRLDGVTQKKDGVVQSFSYRRTSFGFSLLEDFSGSFWIGGYGLHRLSNGVLTQLSGTNGLPLVMNYHSFWQESDSSVWFATGDHFPGIGVVQYKNGQFRVWGADAGLTNNHIYDVFRDREGNVWLATNKGLNCLRRQAVTNLAGKDGLTDGEVYPIYQEKNGDIWVGGAKLWRYRDGRFETVISRGLRGNPLTVQSLFKDSRGVLWLGVMGGLYRYENNTVTDVPQLHQSTCNAVIEDKNGDIWVASTESGVMQFRGNEVRAHYTTANGLPGNDVKVILEDRNGALWFGTYGGLVLLADGRFTSFTTNDGLASNRIRSLYQDDAGVLWIGTYDGGLSRMKDGKIFSYTTKHGLFNNGVFATLEDRSGNFWISCNRGIYRVKKRELNDVADGKLKSIVSVAYGKEDGMLNTECNGGRQPAGIVSHDGRLWFPTQQGVAIIDPRTVRQNAVPPEVVIEEVLVDKNPVDMRNGAELSPGNSYLEINYTAPSFVNTRHMRFRYRLEGFDEDWVDAGTRRTAYYSHLPHGRYMFHVLGANSDGVWNTTGARLAVVINPAFYQTWWFMALGLLMIGGIGPLIYYRRVAQLKREGLRQQEYARGILETQEAERKRIAGELHDSLGQNLLVIKNRALLASRVAHDTPKVMHHLNEVEATITDAIAEVRNIAQNLHPYQLEAVGLSAAIRSMLGKVAGSSTTRIAGEIDEIDGLVAKKDEINLYRIVQEGLNNVIKHAAATEASVIIRRDGARLLVQVSDNGRGFVVSPQNHFAGMGLRDIAERVHLQSGSLRIDSSPGNGTTLHISLPIVSHDA